MTSQTLINNSPAKASASEPAVCNSEESTSSCESRVLRAMKSQYQLDQQVKFLNLQAEMDSLLQQLKALKEQRQASSEVVLSEQEAVYASR